MIEENKRLKAEIEKLNNIISYLDNNLTKLLEKHYSKK